MYPTANRAGDKATAFGILLLKYRNLCSRYQVYSVTVLSVTLILNNLSNSKCMACVVSRVRCLDASRLVLLEKWQQIHL